MTVSVGPDGTLSFLWADELAALLQLGQPAVRRASHVEPTADCRFTADLSPVGGPVLGPFDLHGEAIRAEREWLERNIL